MSETQPCPPLIVPDAFEGESAPLDDMSTVMVNYLERIVEDPRQLLEDRRRARTLSNQLFEFADHFQNTSRINMRLNLPDMARLLRLGIDLWGPPEALYFKMTYHDLVDTLRNRDD